MKTAAAMTQESGGSQFEYREHEGGVYRARRTEPTLDGLREMEGWNRKLREWQPVHIRLACDVWWFGTPLNAEQVRPLIFTPDYVSELIAQLEEGKEEE